ncbi:hypothetical protein ACFVRB_13235 [Streptomyces nojiriensis]|uniref:hypothetical protein n=1 Tax=Streptomyces nojiriensis TaxID=66374 RepID=UPI0036DE9FE6
MHTARRSIGTVALTGAAALALTGCLPKPTEAFPGRPASQVLNESVTALRGASSFTVSGTTMTKGIPTQVSLSISKTGECKGTMSLRTGYAKVIRTRDDVFVQSDEAFARAQTQDMPKEEADQAFKDATTLWMRQKASDPALKGLTSLCDRDGMLKAFYGFSGAVQGGPTEVDGQKALTITAGRHVFLVATEGEPYLLKVTADGPEGIDLAYTAINQPVQVDVPADKDVYDPDDNG